MNFVDCPSRLARVSLLAVPILFACHGSEPDRAPSPDGAAIRAAWAAQLSILASDDAFAVARSETHVLAFARRKDGSWRMGAELPIAHDWRDSAAGGFKTYVDLERLRASYARYLEWCWSPRSEPPPVSAKSPLAARTSHERLFRMSESIGREERDWSRLEGRCVGAEGRYAWFVVDRIARGGDDDFCGWRIQSPRCVVFRADDGKEWQVYDEAMIDSGER